MKKFSIFLLVSLLISCNDNDNMFIPPTPPGNEEKIICLGNSLTASVYPEILSQLSGLPVENMGVGGQWSDQIAARFGAINIYVDVQNNEIPASGKVNITYQSPNILYSSGIYTGSASGKINGVQGIMTTDENGNWTFKRNMEGDVVECLPHSVFQIDLEENINSHITILWLGRNNYMNTEQVVSNIKSCVDFLNPEKHFLILSILNADHEEEYTGGKEYEKIINLNNTLAYLYPDNFVDIRTVLVNLYNSEIKQDVIDYSNDIPPSSLRSDPIHLNYYGYEIVAKTVYEELMKRGWISGNNNQD